MTMTKKQANQIFSELFFSIDKGTIIPGTDEYNRRQSVYLAKISRIKPQQCYRTPAGMLVRVIRYIPDSQQFYVTRLHDNRRISLQAVNILDGNYEGFRYKRRHEIAHAKRQSELPRTYLIKH